MYCYGYYGFATRWFGTRLCYNYYEYYKHLRKLEIKFLIDTPCIWTTTTHASNSCSPLNATPAPLPKLPQRVWKWEECSAAPKLPRLDLLRLDGSDEEACLVWRSRTRGLHQWAVGKNPKSNWNANAKDRDGRRTYYGMGVQNAAVIWYGTGSSVTYHVARHLTWYTDI